MKNLNQSVVVITGASSGIGRETAELFAVHKCRLALLARNPERIQETVDSVSGSAAEVLALPTDVTCEARVKESFAEILRHFGKIDILVNNAGTGFATDLAKCSLDDYRRIFDTNMTGVFLCTREALPGMIAEKSGHIINISSVVGKTANPGAPLYCASKHALNGYTSGLQQQVAAHNIRVSLVSPAAADTAYWDGRPVDRSKFLSAREVAEVVEFVATRPDGVQIKDVDISALR